MFYLEIINCILTIISVYLLSKEDKIGWIVSVAVCLTMAYIYYDKELWYQCGIQFIFLIQSIIAYLKWDKKVNESIKNANGITIILVYLGISLLSLVWVKNNFLSYTDLTLMFISFIANHLLIYKIKSSWYLWLVYDIISIALCLYLELYITVFLFIILTLICLKTILSNRLQYEKI